MILRCLAALACALLVVPWPAAAAPGDAVFNKAGVWGIDVDDGSCAASMTLKDGSTFLLRGSDGEINVALFAKSKVPRGKTGRIETEAYGFDFKPGFVDSGDALFTADYISARMVAALRLAREVRLLVDGRPVVAVTLDGTGFEEALDGLIACSKGEKGWWGAGVQIAGAEAGKPEKALNNEGFWFIEADDKEPLCTAAVPIEGGGAFVLVAAGGAYGFGLGGETKFKKGRKGRFETDAFAFDFKPAYEGDDYLYAGSDLDSQAVSAIRSAKSVRITIDGRPVADMVLEGTGHAQVMTDLEACSRGRSGWWGKGAPQP